MKQLTPRSCLLGLALAVLHIAAAHAEESLLWKASSNLPPAVVPAYSGSGSPFPDHVAGKVDEDTSGATNESTRLRDEAYTTVRNLMNNGRALQPAMQSIRVGGTLEGNLGAKVLVNNQWLGAGSKLMVRQYKTQQVQDALKTLAQYDPEAYRDLNNSVNAKLAANPTLALVIDRITSQTLVLKGSGGPVMVKINVGQF